MVTMRISQNKSVEVRLKTRYSSQPKRPSQLVGLRAAATSTPVVLMASESCPAGEESRATANVEATLLATSVPSDMSDAMTVSFAAIWGTASCGQAFK